MSANSYRSAQSLFTAPEIVDDSLALISLPAAYIRLREVMETEGSSMDDVAEVVSLDPALAARLLRVANSAFYGLPAQVETISRAVKILGVKQIHDLTLATTIADCFDDMPNQLMDMSTFWYRSLYCGFLTRELGKTAGFRGVESLFVRGLLHDIGHLVLFNKFPRECRQALAKAGDNLDEITAYERLLIGCDGFAVTAELMRTWNLPEVFINCIEHIHHPLEAVELAREASVLHLAVRVTHSMDTDLLLSSVLEQFSDEVWVTTGLEPYQIAEQMDIVSEEMIDAMYTLFTGGLAEQSGNSLHA